MILDHELRSHRSIVGEPEWCSGVELLVSHLTNRRGSFSAVLPEKIECVWLRNRRVVPGVSGVHVLHDVPRYFTHVLPASNCLRELHLDRIDTRNMVHNYVDGTTITLLRNRRLPLVVGQFLDSMPREWRLPLQCVWPALQLDCSFASPFGSAS